MGRFSTNCYVVGCEQREEAIIIDPGFDSRLESQRILGYIQDNFSSLKFIVNTHGHPDHTCGNGVVKDRFPAPILIHECDAHMVQESDNRVARVFGLEEVSPPADTLLHDGDSVKFGRIALEVRHTPGHTPGGISLLGEEQVFTGDTLFAGSIGRTDFPESSRSEMNRSLRMLADLPDQLTVYPGHGPPTTLEEEKRSNPFLQSL